MVSRRSCKGRRSSAAVAAIFSFACICAGGSAAAAELDAATPELLDRIDEILVTDGALSAKLVEPLTALALRQQESGDTDLALVAIERAMQVLRVNRGLHTLEQVPLLKLKLGNEEARGNDAAVWALEQELLELARRHPNDPRAAAVFGEVADRQMQALDEYVDGAKPPELLYGCFYKQWPNSPAGSCTAGSRKIAVQGMLAEAQRNYSAAIGVLLRNGLYDGSALEELEMKLLRGVDLVRSLYFKDMSVEPVPMVPSYIGASRLEPWRSRIEPVAALISWQPPAAGSAASDDLGEPAAPRTHAQLMSPYHRGWQSLRRLYMYSTLRSSPVLEQGDALVQIADWDLLYSRNGKALASYESARELLERADVPKRDMQSLFAPATPIVLPAFQPNPLARRADRPVTGHIDLTFEITKYGRGRAIEIVGAENATDRDVDRVVAIVKRSRFRPRLTEAGVADTAPVAVRYFLQAMGEGAGRERPEQ